MIVNIVIYVAVVYVAAWTAWRLFSARATKTPSAERSRVARLSGRILGGGWIYPGAAIVLAVILFFFGSNRILSHNWTETERAELAHFTDALSFYDDATSLYSNKAKLSFQEWESVNAMLQAALAEGEQAPPELLKILDPELPQKYQEQFLTGLHAGIYGLRFYTAGPPKGIDTVDYHDTDSLETGRRLLGEWNKWFDPKRAEILEGLD